jgi:para-nitrobenzyl esterase
VTPNGRRSKGRRSIRFREFSMTNRTGFLALAGLIGVAAMSPLAAKPAATPVVKTSLGPVRGTVKDGVQFFGGIPFAAPPTGPLRWKATAPAKPWTKVRDASAFGADCPQPARNPGEHPQSEDCLTLNIVTPATGARKLPVLVSIHGGAYFVGSGREGLSRAIPPMVKDGVVIVAPNYRLGRLGFFAHPGLTAEAPGANANYWLMDHVAALQWVRDNIAKFGGDPANVTIIGCSAGGSSVNALMATPKSRGLFVRASTHSGGGLFNANRPLKLAEEQGEAFARRVGVTAQGKAAIAALRTMSVQQILAGDTGAPDFGAVVDGSWLPSPIAIAFARGTAAKLPLMTGSTGNEASVFGLMGFDKPTLEKRFGISFGALGDAYGQLDDAELIRQVQTDFIFTAPAMAMTALAAKAGNPAWSYHFGYVNTARRGQVPGPSHCEDMGYWMGMQRDPSAEDAAVGRMMQAYLLNYVRSGDPNGRGLPAWGRVRAGSVDPLLIGQQTAMAPGFRGRQLAPWYAKWEGDTGQSLGLNGSR